MQVLLLLITSPNNLKPPLAKITEVNTSKFIWKNIICRFEIFHLIVSNKGRQFNNKKVRDLCEELGIKKHFLYHIIPRPMDKSRP